MRRACFWMVTYLSLLVVGCKTEPANQGGKEETPRAEAGGKAVAGAAEAPKQAEAPVGEAVTAKVEPLGMEPGKAPESPPPELPSERPAPPKAAVRPLGVPPPGVPPPPSMPPMPVGVGGAADSERLMVTFVELYCARQRGASDAVLYELYLKLGYPSIAEWDSKFRGAAADPLWAGEAMDRVRAKCAPPASAFAPVDAQKNDSKAAEGGGGAPAEHAKIPEKAPAPPSAPGVPAESH